MFQITKNQLYGIVFSFLLIITYTSSIAKSFAKATNLAMPMQFAAQSLARIQKFVLKEPTNKDFLQAIINETENINKFVHHVKKAALREVDPSFHFIIKRMGADIKFATKSLQNNDIKSARHILSRITGFCISCHTRTAKGREFDFSQSLPPFGEKDFLLKADFMAATRQFDKAIEHYEYFLANKKLATSQPTIWQLAIRRLLAITVRVKQNPSLTMEMISALLDRKAIPAELLEEIRTWRIAAKNWRIEIINKEKVRNPLSKAQSLIEKAKNYRKKTFGLVEFLRASSILHNFLDHEKSREKIGEALYWSGVAAGALDDINFWTMDDYYYEACIRLKTNNFAQKCFKGYSNAQIKNFGNETAIPSYIKKRLKELKHLAGL